MNSQNLLPSTVMLPAVEHVMYYFIGCCQCGMNCHIDFTSCNHYSGFVISCL